MNDKAVTIATVLLPEGVCQEPEVPWLRCEREVSAFPAVPRADASSKRKEEDAASEANVT